MSTNIALKSITLAREIKTVYLSAILLMDELPLKSITLAREIKTTEASKVPNRF